MAITLIGRKVEAQPQLRQHTVSALDIREVRMHLGFPVTSVARTVIDCATNPTIDELLNEARALKLVTDSEIHAAMGRCPGRKGVKAMRGGYVVLRFTWHQLTGKPFVVLAGIVRTMSVRIPVPSSHQRV